MCYCQFNVGDCCEEFIAEVVRADNNENNMVRLILTNLGSSTRWNVSYSGTFGAGCVEGANYAPAFDGRGLCQIDPSPSANGRAMRFDIDDGSNLSDFSLGLSFDSGTGNVYQESDGYVCVHHRTGATNRIITVRFDGSFTNEAGTWTNTNCAVRAANGDIWRSVTGAACKLFGSSTTVRSDLSTVAVTSVNAQAVVSTNGEDFYSVGYDNVLTLGTAFEIFHSDAAGTPTRLAGGTCTAGGCGAFNKIGEYLFLSNMDDKIWRYHIPTGTLTAVLTRTAGTWGTWYGPGQHFFVPPVD